MEKVFKTWKVEIRFEGKRSADILSLIDVSELTENYIQIPREFFDSLIHNVKENFEYSIGKGIQAVFDPLGKNWTENPWILLMAKDHSGSARFWFLFKRERNLSGYLVAIGPNSYYQLLADKEGNREDEMKKLIEYILAYIKKFNILMLIPNFID